MPFPYNPALPNPPDNPSGDVAGMKTNAASINAWTQVDHVGFNLATGGQHLQVTIPDPLAADPVVSSPVGEVYTKLVSAVTQLFFTNSVGPVQLTGFASSIGGNGYITLAGGLILQWGTGTGSLAGTGNTFPIAFPHNCFTVQFSPIGATPRSQGTSVPTLTGFTAYLSTNTPSNIYYFAIGN